MFAERPAGIGITFMGPGGSGGSSKQVVANGDEVALKIDDEQVLIHQIRITAPGRYRGAILGFEPSGALEYKGLKQSQEVEFGEKHIFSCTGA